jgi:hypothetical protein
VELPSAFHPPSAKADYGGQVAKASASAHPCYGGQVDGQAGEIHRLQYIKNLL